MYFGNGGILATHKEHARDRWCYFDGLKMEFAPTLSIIITPLRATALNENSQCVLEKDVSLRKETPSC